MIDLDLRDPNLVKNVTAIRGLQELGLPDKEIQRFYDNDALYTLIKIPEMEPIITQVMGQMHTEYENGALRAVQMVGFDVDKDRLLQALTDARAFYEEGYRAAMRRSEWISVHDHLPKESGSYLVATKNGGVMITRFYAKQQRFSSTRLNRLITHWRYRPAPPKEG